MSADEKIRVKSMRTIYLECGMGASGNMLAGALLELLPNPEAFLAEMNRAGIPSVTFETRKTVLYGLSGTYLSVKVDGREEGSGNETEKHTAHASRGITEIGETVSGLHLPEEVRQSVMAVYGLLAEAESHVHGKPVSLVHFHEVGALDAVADIAAVCLLFHKLTPERILASPVCVGGGEVQCAHGTLPVPAPAAAFLLRGIPVYEGTVKRELCTPTGAVLLRHFVSDFGPLPEMRISEIGYGMGSLDCGKPDCLRAFLGETPGDSGAVTELCCNLDDMTPEAVAFAQERLLENGALDVSTAAVQMKKGRPGILLSCLCEPEQREEMARLMFRYTTTLGVREREWSRYTLRRSERTVQTECGPVRVKTSEGFGVRREKAEYDDLARIARERNLMLEEARQLAENR